MVVPLQMMKSPALRRYRNRNGATQRLLGTFQPPVDRRRNGSPPAPFRRIGELDWIPGHATRKNSGGSHVRTCEAARRRLGMPRSCIDRRLTRQG